jgi:hypothetical protein
MDAYVGAGLAIRRPGGTELQPELDCGTPIYSAPPGDVAKVVSLRVGTIRQRDELPPTDQYWFRSAEKWLQNLSAIKRMDKQPIFDPKGGFRR